MRLVEAKEPDGSLPHADHLTILGVTQRGGGGWYRTFDGNIPGDSRGYATREQALDQQRKIIDQNRALAIRGETVISFKLAADETPLPVQKRKVDKYRGLKKAVRAGSKNLNDLYDKLCNAFPADSAEYEQFSEMVLEDYKRIWKEESHPAIRDEYLVMNLKNICRQFGIDPTTRP